MTEQLVTRRHAASLLGLAPATLAGWACRHPERHPRPIRIGGAVRYRLSEILAIARGETPAVATPTAERAA